MFYLTTALICLNGHVLAYDVDELEHKEPCCSQCGAKTISTCPSCGTPIKGCYVEELKISTRMSPGEPLFCHECGKPFPWMQAELDEIEALIAMSDDLTSEEKKSTAYVVSKPVYRNPTHYFIRHQCRPASCKIISLVERRIESQCRRQDCRKRTKVSGVVVPKAPIDAGEHRDTHLARSCRLSSSPNNHRPQPTYRYTVSRNSHAVPLPHNVDK